MRPLTALALLVVLTVLGSGCDASDASFDLDRVEADITDSLTAAYAEAGHTLFGVSCARDGADAGVGDVFACVADVERRFVRVQVEVTVAGGGYEFTTLDVVLVMDDVEELVAVEMSERLGDTITLDCGSPNLRVLPIGSSFRCDATDSGRNTVPALLTAQGPGQTAWELVR